MTAAEYQALHGGKGKSPPRAPNNAQVPRTAPKPTTDTPAPVALNQGPVFVTFTGKVPGNNGPGGLLRMHWSRRQKLLSEYEWVVSAARLPKLSGPVRLVLTRYSTGPEMDYDNLVSTGKLLIDALVNCGVLPDDSPAVIVERHYRQLRTPGPAHQKTIISISPALAAGILSQQ
ncbi:hypothetical protein LJ737_20825 [Hymenobacter sp. 15J16-1T3B]|uniref:hypothetical protein n=1 Tax=Hymenobacter sp. 15J16-1T3B TaxID=2886941 RepID=UPI001D1068A4|nr:hypothetical protein [Hymenobacter sp. 15J16-1T3B]MCC3159698.1 hypothetical protein [Hymenobacter sp. 15J16-1T3B]